MHMSYAQRLEDYHLDRVFAGQRRGIYIDVGAGHPVADNVSFWFYLAGWNGLVVEPQDELIGLYPLLRPRDIAVAAVLGREEGETDFHVVAGMHGFSTAVAANARAAGDLGAAVQTVRRPMTTLSRLAAAHGLAEVDFLKIDVEGGEADVLAGADWRRCRPRVVLVEALAPGTLADTSGTWEPGLLAQGYRHAFFDGLNRFYVAEEAAALAERFPSAPAAWDSVAHLYDCGRADRRPDHPDHALARALVEGLLAALPRLDRGLLCELLARHAGPAGSHAGRGALAELVFGRAEYPGETGSAPDETATDDEAALRELLDTDRFRAALGRIAAAYDGGHIMEPE